MKKKFSLLSMILVFIFIVGLVGCSPGENPAAPVDEPAAPVDEPAAPVDEPAEPVEPAEQAEDPADEAEPTPIPVEAGPKMGGTMVWAELGDFNSWNAWTMSGTNDIMHNLVYSRLLWKDASGEVHPDLATDWELSEDGLTMTLNLRKDVKWHDGKDFTAHDYVEMFGYTKDEVLLTVSGVQKINGLIKTFNDVVAIDDYTLELTFPQPIPFIYDILDYWYAILLPDKEDGNLTKTMAVGTGPFKMIEWKPKEYVRFEKFADYYNKDAAYLDEFIIRRLDQAETLVPNLLSGSVQGIGKVPFSNVETIDADPNYHSYIVDTGNIVNVIVNTNKPPLDKKEVRQALSYALDRQLIADEVYYGLVVPTTSPFYSPASIAYQEDLVMAHEFNLEKARQLLDDAGVETLELSFVTGTGFPEWKIYAQIWQSDLAKIGVTLTIDEFENAKFYEIALNNPDLDGYDLAGWGTGRTKRDPAIFYQTQQQYAAGEKAGLANPYGWYNAEYEDLVAQGRIELDPKVRAELYQRANEILVEELPMIQVCSNTYVAGLHNDVQGIYTDLLGIYGFDLLWLDQ